MLAKTVAIQPSSVAEGTLEGIQVSIFEVTQELSSVQLDLPQ